MAKKARGAPAEKPAESEAIAAAVERLADAVVVLRDVLEEIREDLSWLTRNGLPIQPIEHVVVKRMALDPCDPDWNEKLEVERYSYPADASASPVDGVALGRMAEELTATIEAIAQCQLDIVLAAIDGVRNEILTGLKGGDGQKPNPPTEPVVEQPTAPPTAEPDSSRPAPPRGRLF